MMKDSEMRAMMMECIAVNPDMRREMHYFNNDHSH